MRTGIKGAYSEGLYDGSFYSKPYLRGICETGPAFVSLTGAGLLAYSIYDAEGNQKEVNLGQGVIELGFRDLYGFGASFQYEGTAGQSGYRQNDISGSVEYMVDPFRIGTGISYGTNSYVFSGDRIDSNSLAVNLEGEYYCNSWLSFDMSFSYMHSTSDSMNLDSDRKNLRDGSCWSYKKIMAMHGLNYGWDSNNYKMYGFDITLGVIIMDSLRLTAMYIFTYNQGDGIVTPGFSLTIDQTTISRGATLADGSYVSHRFLAGVEYMIF